MVRHVHSRDQCPRERRMMLGMALIGVRTAEPDVLVENGEQETLDAE